MRHSPIRVPPPHCGKERCSVEKLCRRHSRAYLRHLFVLGDFSAPMLLSIHNVFFYLEWMKRMREAIGRGDLASVEAPPERKIDSA